MILLQSGTLKFTGVKHIKLQALLNEEEEISRLILLNAEIIKSFIFIQNKIYFLYHNTYILKHFKCSNHLLSYIKKLTVPTFEDVTKSSRRQIKFF